MPIGGVVAARDARDQWPAASHRRAPTRRVGGVRPRRFRSIDRVVPSPICAAAVAGTQRPFVRRSPSAARPSPCPQRSPARCRQGVGLARTRFPRAAHRHVAPGIRCHTARPSMSRLSSMASACILAWFAGALEARSRAPFLHVVGIIFTAGLGALMINKEDRKPNQIGWRPSLVQIFLKLTSQVRKSTLEHLGLHRCFLSRHPSLLVHIIPQHL